MLEKLLENYGIHIPGDKDVSILATVDGFLILEIKSGRERFLVPIAHFPPPDQNLPISERFSLLAAIANNPVGATFFLEEEAIARVILAIVDPERARSSFWKQEDWEYLEMESA